MVMPVIAVTSDKINIKFGAELVSLDRTYWIIAKIANIVASCFPCLTYGVAEIQDDSQNIYYIYRSDLGKALQCDPQEPCSDMDELKDLALGHFTRLTHPPIVPVSPPPSLSPLPSFPSPPPSSPPPSNVFAPRPASPIVRPPPPSSSGAPAPTNFNTRIDSVLAQIPDENMREKARQSILAARQGVHGEINGMAEDWGVREKKR